jgi:hypothetical protein
VTGSKPFEDTCPRIFAPSHERYKIGSSMKNLGDALVQQQVKQRLERLQPNSQGRWGRMSAGQMVCHLTDSFRRTLGEKETSNLPPKKFLKVLALWLPFPWPHGFKTRPELDQEIGGTRPVAFEADRQELLGYMGRFICESPVPKFSTHPIFGQMTRKELMRWAYLHMDHHLRQFGA